MLYVVCLYHLLFTANGQCLTIWSCQNSKVAGAAKWKNGEYSPASVVTGIYRFYVFHTDGHGYIVPTDVAGKIVEDVSFNLLNI